MGLFKRVSDIISANLNDLIEKFEDPEKMLNQVIREMETAIGDAKREVVKAMAGEKLVRKQLASYERQAAEARARAVRAVENGDDRLARKALTRKQESLTVAAALKDQLALSAETSQTLRRQLEAMQVKIAEARRRLVAFTARQRVAEVRAKLQKRFESPRGATGAFARFDELQQRVERVEAEAEALEELEAEREFAPEGNPEVDSAVETELSELKQSLKSPSG